MSRLRQITYRRIEYAIFDLLTAAVGWLCFNILRFGTLPDDAGYSSLADFLLNRQVLLGQFIVPFCMVALYAVSGSYNKANTLHKSRLDEVLNAAVVSFAGMLGIYFTVLIDDNIPERVTSYELMGMLWLCLAMPTAVVRIIEVTMSSEQTRKGEFVMRTLVVGLSEANCAKLKKIMRSGVKTGHKIIGYTSADGAPVAGAPAGLRHYEGADVPAICRRLGVQAVVVMPVKGDFVRILSTINALYPLDIPIFVTPDLFSLIAMRPKVSSVIGEPLVDITNAGIAPWAMNCKRIGDIVASAIALAILSPLLAALAIAVRLDSPGPAIYRQRRIGFHKKPFTIYKFRTMRSDAEASGPELATKDDPRVTRLGHILRKYRLDELPQFWNVLRGDMSLVGPRPEREYYLRQLMERHPATTLLHQVRPGITSWGMVKYGYAADIEQMLERLPYDMLYLENMSLGVDLKILFHTVDTVVRGRGQ